MSRLSNHPAARALIVAAACALGGAACMWLPRIGPGIVPQGVAAGIAIALLFRWGTRYALALFPAVLVIQWSAGATSAIALGAAAGAAIGPALAASTLARTGFGSPDRRAPDFVLYVLAIAAGMAVAVAPGAVASMATGALDLARSVLPWWIADTLAALLSAALVPGWSNPAQSEASGADTVDDSATRLAAERARLALEHTDRSLFDWNLATGAIFLSREWSLMLGGPAVETRSTARKLARLVHPGDRATVRAAIRDTLKSRSGEYRMEHRVRTRRGDWMWIEVHGRVVERDADGRAVRALGVNRAINERKLAELALHESRERYAELTRLTSDWYWEQDTEFRFVSLDGDLQSKTGISVEAHIGQRRWDMPALNMTDEDWARHRALLERHEPFHGLEMRRPDAGGRQHWVSISGRPRFDKAGRFIGYRGVGQDITARKLAEEALRQSEAKFATAFRASPEMISISTVADGRYLDVNPACEATIGYTREEMIGRTSTELGIWVDAGERDRVMRQLRADGHLRNAEMRLRRKSGEIVVCEASAEPVEVGGVPCLLAIIADVTERKRAERKIRDQARFDALTGVAQRGWFLDQLGQALERTLREGTRLAVLYVDLDRFKDINDALGHGAGDEVLKTTARRIRSTLRASDVVGRLGGDEFVVILDECRDRVQVAVVAAKLHACFATADAAETHRFPVTISVGVALCPDDARTAEDLLGCADAALYEAKRAGRNRVHFYSPGS